MEDLSDANDEYFKDLNELKEETHKNNEITNLKNLVASEEEDVGENPTFLENKSQSLSKTEIEKKPNSKGKKQKTPIKGKGKNKPNAKLQVKKKGLQVKLIANKELLKFSKGIEKYAKCQKKTGILNLIKGQSQLPFVLNLLPTYIHLGLSTFNIYKTTNSKTLISTIKIVDIERVNQRKILTKFNCFDLVLADNVNLRLKDDDLITLCAKNRTEMQNWIHTILEFKECQVNVRSLNNADQVMLDYKKVDELLKQHASGNSSRSMIPPEKKIMDLRYDSSNAYKKPPEVIFRQAKVRRIVENIMNSMKKGNIRNDKVQRELRDKLKRARKFRQDVGKKQGDIEELVAKRVNLERKKEIVKVGKKEKKKELALLKAVEQRINQLKIKEIKDLSKKVKKQIDNEKKKASKEAKNMMWTLINAKKNTPYDDCIDNRVLNFADNEYTSALCKRYYGEFVSFYLFLVYFILFYFILSNLFFLRQKTNVT